MIKNKVKSIVSIVLAAAVALSGVAVGVVSYLKRGTTIEIAQGEPDGMAVSDIKANGLSLKVSALAETEVEDGAIMTDSAYTVQITPDPVDAIDTYEWSVSNSEVISLSVSEDTKSCTVNCLAPFGTQVTLTVVSKITDSVGAEVLLDYMKELTGVTVTSPTMITFNTSSVVHTISADPVYGVGTITPDFAVSGGSLHCNITGTTMVQISNSFKNKIYRRRAVLGDFVFTGNTFTVTTPAACFIKSTTTETLPGVGPVAPTSYREVAPCSFVAPLAVGGMPTVAALENAYNNSIASKATGVNDGTLTFNYSYSYNGVSLGSDTYTVNVGFDLTSIASYASNVDSGVDQIIFI